jgi:hypothetical protein
MSGSPCSITIQFNHQVCFSNYKDYLPVEKICSILSEIDFALCSGYLRAGIEQSE